MSGKCTKQEVIAIIENNGRYWIDSNWGENAPEECPRGDMPSGVGYELCHDICETTGHAEANVCKKAGHHAEGGTLYLIGHTYCCDSCTATMEKYGIKEVKIGELPERFKVANG